jgi:1,4-dihydroxy-2-naphthoate octaprenyltransferase
MSKTRVRGRNIALTLLGCAMFVAGLLYTAHWSWRGFADWRAILAYVGFGFVVWMVTSSIESAQMKARADSEQMIAGHQRKSKAIHSEVQVL